ncbi:MAG: Transposase [Polaromonas sp.]|nr:Transposase [Polaromonas sp.]
MSSCTRIPGGFCGAVRPFAPDAGPTAGLSHVSGWIAAAARPLPKTLTALVGAEPLVQAQAAEVQRLQFFLSEAAWDAEAINAKRLALLADEPATSPSANGVLIID